MYAIRFCLLLLVKVVEIFGPRLWRTFSAPFFFKARNFPRLLSFPYPDEEWQSLTFRRSTRLLVFKQWSTYVTCVRKRDGCSCKQGLNNPPTCNSTRIGEPIVPLRYSNFRLRDKFHRDELQDVLKYLAVGGWVSKNLLSHVCRLYLRVKVRRFRNSASR